MVLQWSYEVLLRGPQVPSKLLIRGFYRGCMGSLLNVYKATCSYLEVQGACNWTLTLLLSQS